MNKLQIILLIVGTMMLGTGMMMLGNILEKATQCGLN